MKVTVEFSLRARNDVRAAVRWLEANRTVAVADRWLRQLASVVESIEKDALRYPQAEESDELLMDLRVALIGKRPNVYRVLFYVDQGTAYVVRIRHSARNRLTGDDL